jgi:hypothetical protein
MIFKRSSLMGVSYYVQFNKMIPLYNASEEIIGKSFARADNELKKIYKKLKLKPIIEFFGQDQSDLLGEGEETPAEELPWFEPEEGLKTIQGLIHYLNENPNAIKNAADVMNDLIEFEKALEICSDKDAKWHLAMDI